MAQDHHCPEPNPMNLAYTEINALGGYVDAKDPAQVARDEVLGEVLAILERFGAQDAQIAIRAAS